jgi:hypothetical protein
VPKLSAEEALPAELLGLLLAHPEIVSEAAERLDCEMLRECPEKELLRRVLEPRKGRAWETGRFLNSLADPALAAAASRAMAEELARGDRIKETSAKERLEGYLGYLGRKEVDTARAAIPTDDEQVREYERRLRERDQKSAEPRKVQEL